MARRFLVLASLALGLLASAAAQPRLEAIGPVGRVRGVAFSRVDQFGQTREPVRQGVNPFGPVTTAETDHLTVMSAASADQVAPGSRISLVFDITPRRGMHVYAPGKHTYQVVRVTFDPQPWARVHPINYPSSEIYEFKPLNERVEVYQKPFRLVQDVTILATPEVQKKLAGQTSVTISGRLEYQACDDRVCYAPRSVAMKWALPLKKLDRKPPD